MLVSASASAYANNVTIIMLSNRHINLIGETMQEHEVETGAKVNLEKINGFTTQHLERQANATQQCHGTLDKKAS